MMSIFQKKSFLAHSGSRLEWRVECDALMDSDIETLAWIIARRTTFSQVIGIPRGGIRLATALRRYTRDEGGILVVDDVLTSGASMMAMRERYPQSRGVVLFDRSGQPLPDGVCAVWRFGLACIETILPAKAPRPLNKQ
jgi:hypothetical protein